MPRVLITGGSGQVGTALIASVPPGYEILAPESRRLDISDARSVVRAFEEVRPDVVINAAAHTAVDKAESERDRAFSINADGAGNVARACRASQTPLIHLSTDYVFDGTKTSAYVEEDRPNPVNVYGASKLAGELQIQEAGIPHLIIRVSWVFSATRTNFVKTMLGLSGRDSLRVVDDQRGTPCSAADIAKVVWLCTNRRDTTVTGTLMHFASAPVTTWFGFANEIFETALALGAVSHVPRVEPIPAAEYPTAARRPANSILDSSKLQRHVASQPPDWPLSLRAVIRELGQKSAKPGA